ncbi:MAG: serine hydroxymethyltransferase, partial [Gammaproteobacteria bacterium]|nr:serine hydroxymethyltransferase [Gammaproteobacteria bacterium]
TEQDATDLATWMCDIIDSIQDDTADTAIVDGVREKVTAICQRLPVYES